MNDVSIILCSDNNEKDGIKSALSSWSSRGFLKDYYFLEEYSEHSYSASRCSNGEYQKFNDLNEHLTTLEIDFVRIVSLSSPEVNNFDIKAFNEYLNPPSNIKVVYLNVIVPLKGWNKNKKLLSGTHLANANILISPVDRANPLRQTTQITKEKFPFFASANIATIAALWRGQKYGEFDNEKRNMQGKVDFIVARNFVRLLLATDPIDGLIDSLTTENGEWITPQQSYERPNSDLFIVHDLANKVMDKYYSTFNFVPFEQDKKRESLSFLNFFKNRYSSIDFNSPLPFLNQKMESVNQLNELFEKKTDLEILNTKDDLDSINMISRTIISSSGLRKENNIPDLWKDIRFIIFSLLDGSKIPEAYSESKIKKSIILNNSNSIVRKTKKDHTHEESDGQNEIKIELDNAGITNNDETTFFDFFTTKLNNEIKKILSNFREALENLLKEMNESDNNLMESYEKLKNRTRLVDKLLSVYFLNIILFITNQILVNGGYVDVLITLSILDILTPRFVFFVSLLLVIYWIYLTYQLYKKFLKVHSSNNSAIEETGNIALQLVKFQSILSQFELWTEIYRELIHETLDKNNLNLDLDDDYVSFKPLHSVKGAVGSIKKEVIRDIQDTFIKEGWFYDIYKTIEEQFKISVINKLLRPDENLINQIDSENTGFNDKNSARFMFYEFLKDKQSNRALKNYLQDNIAKITEKTTADELFSEKLVSGEDLGDFLGEIKETTHPAEKEFDKNIWSNLTLVFDKKSAIDPKKQDVGSTLFSIKAGSPIQRVVLRTDPTERLELSAIINERRKEYKAEDQNVDTVEPDDSQFI